MNMKVKLAFAATLLVGTATLASATDIIGDSGFDSAIARPARTDALAAFAQVGNGALRRNGSPSRAADSRRQAGNPAHVVYDNQGRYVGTDPDPLVRLELARVPPGRDE